MYHVCRSLMSATTPPTILIQTAYIRIFYSLKVFLAIYVFICGGPQACLQWVSE